MTVPRTVRIATLCALLLLSACASTQPASTSLPPTTRAQSTAPVPAPDMVLVEPGTFEMGSDEGNPDEQLVHTVQITRAFYLGRYEVTFDEYDRFCEDTGRTKADDEGRGRGKLPVIRVTWYDAVAYCNWLSEQHGLAPCYSGTGRLTECDWTADGYRLPTEAEWEYAARGGQKSRGYLYAGSHDPDQVAWYEVNSRNEIQPVGQKQPNELGLYDMSGNLFEWCWDWYGSEYYASSPSQDPTGPPPQPVMTPRGPERVRRSGSWREDAINIRTTSRSFDYASYVGDNGFRLARTIWLGACGTAAPTVMPAATPRPLLVTESAGNATLTVLYDNDVHDPTLEAGWGFACLVETVGSTVLFDTAASGPALLKNMAALGKDPLAVDAVVLSHAHEDHTAGLASLLAVGARPTVYLLSSFSTAFQDTVRSYTKVVTAPSPAEVAPGIYTTGLVSGSVPEQALIVRSEEGLTVVTGCAHPGVVTMVQQSIDVTAEQVTLVLGGFHLAGSSESQISTVIERLHGLGVRQVGPSHCTGDQARALFEASFADGYIALGVGRVLVLGP